MATAQGHKLVPCGAVPATQYMDFISTLHSLLDKRKSDHKKRREEGNKTSCSGQGVKAGFQSTPAMVLAVAKDALQLLQQVAAKKAAKEAAAAAAASYGLGSSGAAAMTLSGLSEGVPSSHPRGGFTDVGRHTGHEKRSTCWPLARAALQVRPPVHINT